MTVATQPPRRSMSSLAKAGIWVGEALDTASQALLLTGDNGFLDGAQYDSTYLNGATSYLDTSAVRRASATETMIQSTLPAPAARLISNWPMSMAP